MKKYYEPELQEFHYEFEYEILMPVAGYEKRVFGKDEINHPELEQYKSEFMQLAHAITRVKYLDREDFESIYGMMAVNQPGRDIIVNGLVSRDGIECDAQILYNPTSHWLTIIISGAPIFSGECLNKSEYLKLTKRLKLAV